MGMLFGPSLRGAARCVRPEIMSIDVAGARPPARHAKLARIVDPGTGAAAASSSLNLSHDPTCAQRVSASFEFTLANLGPCSNRIGSGADGVSRKPRIGLDGDGNMVVVVFESEATDLVAGDGNGAADILRRELIGAMSPTTSSRRVMSDSTRFNRRSASCRRWR